MVLTLSALFNQNIGQVAISEVRLPIFSCGPLIGSILRVLGGVGNGV